MFINQAILCSLVIFFVSCGSDDSANEAESLSLWSDEQLSFVVEGCSENPETITAESAKDVCQCFYSHLSRLYTYEDYAEDVEAIIAREGDKRNECLAEYGEEP